MLKLKNLSMVMPFKVEWEAGSSKVDGIYYFDPVTSSIYFGSTGALVGAETLEALLPALGVFNSEPIVPDDVLNEVAARRSMVEAAGDKSAEAGIKMVNADGKSN